MDTLATVIGLVVGYLGLGLILSLGFDPEASVERGTATIFAWPVLGVILIYRFLKYVAVSVYNTLKEF